MKCFRSRKYRLKRKIKSLKSEIMFNSLKGYPKSFETEDICLTLSRSYHEFPNPNISLSDVITNLVIKTKPLFLKRNFSKNDIEYFRQHPKGLVSDYLISIKIQLERLLPEILKAVEE